MAEITNYTTAEDVLIFSGKNGTDTEVPAYLLDWADELIEDYTGQGYKGRTKTVRHRGNGNRLLRLFAPAETITEVIEVIGTYNKTLVADSDYELWAEDNQLHRLGYPFVPDYLSGNYASTIFTDGSAKWRKGAYYKVTYTEPTEAPARWHKAATEIAAHGLMWIGKHAANGIATTNTRAGSISGGSQSITIGFPDRHAKEIRQILADNFDRGGAL